MGNEARSSEELEEETRGGWAGKTDHPFHSRGTLSLYFPPAKQGSRNGYEVRCADGSWEPLVLAPNELAVGVGQMLTRYTNGRFCTMPGRGGPSGEGACGIFALYPDDEALVKAMPGLQQEEGDLGVVWAAESAGQVFERAMAAADRG